MQLLKLLKLPYAIWNFHKFQDFQYLSKFYNFEVLTPPLLLIRGRSPYCLSKFSPVPASGSIPMRLSFNRYMAKNSKQEDVLSSKRATNFSATASLA